jgi:hypothetical protein
LTATGFGEVLVDVAFVAPLALCILMLSFVAAVILRCRHPRIRGRGREAEQKAHALLTEWFSPGQRVQYEANGYFDVRGCDSGKRYRIRYERYMNIDEFDARGRGIAVWCFGPEGALPVGDIMLAQKIALESNERSSLAIANRTPP